MRKSQMEEHIDKIGLKKEDATLTEQIGIMEFMNFLETSDEYATSKETKPDLK